MKPGQAIITSAEMKHPPYNLKGSALEVFSALYCLTRKRAFRGTYQDLAYWIEIEVHLLRRTLKKLQERGLVTIEKEEFSDSRYEFQAHQIKGYPLPDYKYSGKRSYTDAPIIDSQNAEEYRTELEQVQNVPTEVQNVPTKVQNVPISKEKNQKKIYYNISTKQLKREEEEGQKPTTAATQKDFLEEDFVPYPKSLKEVWEYAQEKQPGISAEVVRDFFVYYSAKGWRYKSNGRVRNWKAELFLFDQRGKRWEREKAARAITHYQQGSFGNVQRGVTQDVLDLEEQMRQQRRREQEEHDKQANSPEAIAARDAFFEKHCK